jgi:protein transport protein SEC31
LITISNLPSAQGKTQSSVLHRRKIVTEADLVERAKKLMEAVRGDNLQGLAEAAATGAESWKALFKANSQEELITLLSFSKDEVVARVSEAVQNLKVHKTASEEDKPAAKPHEYVVSFIDPLSDPK